MERLNHIKDILIECIQEQLSDIHNADTHELGEVIDMIKDIEEATYYCTIIKSMNHEKGFHKDKKVRDLDQYMKELSEDLVEMIDDASPEEKQLLEKKVSALATKVSSLNHA